MISRRTFAGLSLAATMLVSLAAPAWAESAAERAVKEAQKYKGWSYLQNCKFALIFLLFEAIFEASAA